MAASKVLHGTGKPSIVLFEKYSYFLSFSHQKVGDFTYKLIISGDEEYFTDFLLNRAFIIVVGDGGDAGNPEKWEKTWGKIISYDKEALTITVSGWRGKTPAADNTGYKWIGGKVIDLPYCQSLVETFTPDNLEPKKLFNGKKIQKIRGYYYSASLDYSAYADAALLNKVQELFNSERTESFTFYPRLDNPIVNYNCEIDEEGALSWAQHVKHQGYKYVVLNISGLERLSKIDLSSTNEMPIIDNEIPEEPSSFDRITQGMIDSWNTAVAHIYDLIRHITGEERTNWNEAFNKRHEHSNKDVIDLITAVNTNNWNSHLADQTNPHSVDKTQIGLGNVTNDAQIRRDEMGQPNGVATLAADGKIPTSQLNPIAISDTFVVNNEAAQIALIAQTGDVCVRTDINSTFINNGESSGTMADWTELLTPGKVVSVNGKTGAVTLTYSDIGASASSHNHALASLSEKSYNSLTDKPGSFPPSTHTHSGSEITSAVPDSQKLGGNLPAYYSPATHNHALAALSEKSYNSLTDKPSSFIPVPHSHTGSEITSAVTDSQRLGGNLPPYFATATHIHNVKVSHTFAISGEIKVPSGDDDFIPPYFIASPGSLIAARFKINSGTSATLKIQKNGTDVVSGIAVRTTVAENDFPDITTAAGDQIGIVVTAVSGTPKNLSFTIYVSYRI